MVGIVYLNEIGNSLLRNIISFVNRAALYVRMHFIYVTVNNLTRMT